MFGRGNFGKLGAPSGAGSGGAAPGGPAAAAYLYRGSGTTSSGNNDATFSIDIGTASADRLVIVGCTVGNNTTITSVVVAGVTLTADISAVNNYRVAIYSGVVNAGDGAQNVVITWASAAFQEKNAFVWTATGLASNLKKQTTSYVGTTGSINVTAGDFMFVVGRDTSTAPVWTTSTEAPAASRNVATLNTGADWTILATNAAFAINSGSANQVVAATYI